MKVAILHYWFLQDGGGEKVIEKLLEMYPSADIFCLFAEDRYLPPGARRDRIHCSFLNRISFLRKFNRALFPLYAAAVGSFDFSQYDLVISSDSPPTKSIVTPVDTLHISYCHTPGRFIWDLGPSFGAGLPSLAQPVFSFLTSNARESDFIAAQRVDHIVANSQYVAKRIRKYYRREATVIYPPVDTAQGYLSDHRADFYLSVGRLVENKRIDLLIRACNELERRLVIAGEGRDERALKAMAGRTIEFVGHVSDAERSTLYSRSRAVLFAADEDFGLVPVEAQSFGVPVIAYGHGGVLETVRVDDPECRPDTGVFFGHQTVEAVTGAIRAFEAREDYFNRVEIQSHAQQFDSSVFVTRFQQFVRMAVFNHMNERVLEANLLDPRSSIWNKRGEEEHVVL